MSKPKFDPEAPFKAVASKKPKFDPKLSFEALPSPDDGRSPPVATEPDEEEGGILDAIGEGLQSLQHTADSYLGTASARAAVGKLLDGGGLGEAGEEALAVYGDASKAPTARNLVEKTGLPEDAISRYMPDSIANAEAPKWYQPMTGPQRLARSLGRKGGLTDTLAAGVDMVLDPVALAAAPAAKIAGRALKTGAESLTKLHLRPTPKVAEALGEEGLQAASREALDSGAVQFGAKAKSTAKRLDNLTDEVGSVLDDIVQTSTGEVDPVHVARRFEDEILAPLRATNADRKVVARLEEEMNTFLNKYAPGYEPGGRAPGTPTTITRKSEFVPVDPTIDYEAGLKQVGEKVSPNIETEIVSAKPEYEGGYGMQPKQELRVYNTGETRTPVMGYSTPEPGVPYKTDPKTGYPAKVVTEKRLEGVPPTKKMRLAQSEAEKSALYRQQNYLTEAKGVNKGFRDFARILKEAGEEVESNPVFMRAKEAFGNLDNASQMAGRTGSLTDGGGGLMGHITDQSLMNAGIDLVAQKKGLVAASIAAARALTKGRLSSSGAVMADALGKVASSPSGPALAYGAVTAMSKPVDLEVPEVIKPDVREAIRTSGASPTQRAKLLNDLNRSGRVSASDLEQVLGSLLPPEPPPAPEQSAPPIDFQAGTEAFKRVLGR